MLLDVHTKNLLKKCTYFYKYRIAIEKSMEESEDRLIALKNYCAKYEVSDF